MKQNYGLGLFGIWARWIPCPGRRVRAQEADFSPRRESIAGCPVRSARISDKRIIRESEKSFRLYDGLYRPPVEERTTPGKMGREETDKTADPLRGCFYSRKLDSDDRSPFPYGSRTEGETAAEKLVTGKLIFERGCRLNEGRPKNFVRFAEQAAGSRSIAQRRCYVGRSLSLSLFLSGTAGILDFSTFYRKPRHTHTRARAGVLVFLSRLLARNPGRPKLAFAQDAQV